MSTKVSILVITHNAPDYVDLTLRSLRRNTIGIDYEVVVVDNASNSKGWGKSPRQKLLRLFEEGFIEKLIFLNYNSLFAAGNNIAARNARADSTHFVLLNSDVEIKRSDWLANLLSMHVEGIISYGVVDSDAIPRADGYCLLIDAPLYRRYQLDENHQWWWAVTKLQAKLLIDGYSVQGLREHEAYLHHFGGKSGDGFAGAKGMDVTPESALSWFGGKNIKIIP